MVVAKLADLFLRDERRGRAHLPVVANHDDLLPPQQSRQLGDVGLRGLVYDDQFERTDLRRRCSATRHVGMIQQGTAS